MVKLCARRSTLPLHLKVTVYPEAIRLVFCFPKGRGRKLRFCDLGEANLASSNHVS